MFPRASDLHGAAPVSQGVSTVSSGLRRTTRCLARDVPHVGLGTTSLRHAYFDRAVSPMERPAPLTWRQIPPDYADQIRRVRQRLGLTQTQLAARVGAACKAVVYEWESRKALSVPGVLAADTGSRRHERRSANTSRLIRTYPYHLAGSCVGPRCESKTWMPIGAGCCRQGQQLPCRSVSPKNRSDLLVCSSFRPRKRRYPRRRAGSRGRWSDLSKSLAVLLILLTIVV